MRIISGTARGTNLFTLEGTDTRPTLDRVKESLFNIINLKIYDAVVLDLFSGSGAIGLEFASRGAKEVVLCDNSKKATQIIQKNIEKTHLQEKVKLYNCDYIELLENSKDKKFDIIYLDPPYKTDYIIEAINLILDFDLIDEDGLIIAETDEPERIESELNEKNITILDKRKYGRAYLIFI
ncbi:MAG: 16S rRNA (guanine(966)-N(2))-methyltransferase RsmD [Clostridia bacterium]|nr:16S rRNA (guanine(966)-N(2))-methyltransferase RsmD [Clostridia bacterium]